MNIGKLVAFTKRKSIFFISVFLIVATLALFFTFEAPFLWVHISPAVPILIAPLSLVVLANLFKTSFSDPGFLPRAELDELEVDRKLHRQQLSLPDNLSNGVQGDVLSRTKDVTINGVTVRLKRCSTCQMYRPPRCSHCSVCDSCVLSFDHHCPWVGNCVGQRNYQQFYFFLLLLTLLIMVVLVFCVLHLFILTRTVSLSESIKQAPYALAICIICFFSFFSLCCLSSFHTYLVCRNLTTNEDVKGTFSSKRRPRVRNPFQRETVVGNCCSRLCSPQIPNLSTWRSSVHPVHLSPDHRSPSRSLGVPTTSDVNMSSTTTVNTV